MNTPGIHAVFDLKWYEVIIQIAYSNVIMVVIIEPKCKPIINEEDYYC